MTNPTPKGVKSVSTGLINVKPWYSKHFNRILVVGSIIFLLLFTIIYVIILLREPQIDVSTALIRLLVDMLPDLITVPLLFLLSYYLLRDMHESQMHEMYSSLADQICERTENNQSNLVNQLSTQISSTTTSLEHYFDRHLQMQNVLQDILLSGAITIHQDLSIDVVAKGVSEAQKSVRILQTWIGNFIPLDKSINKAILHQCEVKILLLNPASMQAPARSKDIGNHNPNMVRDEVNLNLSRLAGIAARHKYPENLKVRLYDATPIITFYNYDDIGFLGLYWRKLAATNGPQIEIHTNSSGYLALIVNEHFEDIWKDAIDVDLTNYVT